MKRTTPSIVIAAVLLARTGPALTLEQCVRTALEFSPDLHAAAARVEAARAMVQQAESARYPQLALSAAYSRTDNPPQAFFMSLNQRQASMMGDFNNPDDTDNTAWPPAPSGFCMTAAGGSRRAGPPGAAPTRRARAGPRSATSWRTS